MMEQQNTQYINIKGHLWDFSSPKVMGILNLTPDSFYSQSRKQTEKEIEEQVSRMVAEGADIIDIGGYSSRPHAAFVDEKEEMTRLRTGLEILSRNYSSVPMSVDTFRSEIARECVEKYGVAMVNDISGGELDEQMFDTVCRLQVPYILMHMKGSPQTMMNDTAYGNLLQEVLSYFSEKIDLLRKKGLNDIIVDPGFGFSKNTDQNYLLFKHLKDFSIFGLPLLVGISRKTMIRDLLDVTVDDSLNGTTVLHTIALLNGASVLRVHDVKEAVQCVKIYNKIKAS